MNYYNKTIRHVIAITGAKGGIGKTSIAVNLALALGQLSQRVMLLDADLGLANANLMLDVTACKNLTNVLRGEEPLELIKQNVRKYVDFLPAGSGHEDMAMLDFPQISGLIDRVSLLEPVPQILLIDTPAGLTPTVLGLSIAASEIFMVVCNEPAAIADAYALIKVLNTKFAVKKFKIITNKVASEAESFAVFAKLSKATDKFLDVSLRLIAAIPADKMLEKAIKKRTAVLESYPHSKSSLAFQLLAQKIVQWPSNKRLSGQLQFVADRLNVY